MISSWSERMIRHTGTETRPKLLREAAVRDFPQWAKTPAPQSSDKEKKTPQLNLEKEQRVRLANQGIAVEEW
jgi:hypothetical protein